MLEGVYEVVEAVQQREHVCVCVCVMELSWSISAPRETTPATLVSIDLIPFMMRLALPTVPSRSHCTRGQVIVEMT